MKKITLVLFVCVCVFTITKAQIITTVAGNGFNAGTGNGGYIGDGGQATAAELYSPVSVAMDASGNVYISDRGNNVIRKVTKTGVISTFAGGGGALGDGGLATAASLNSPWGIAVDDSGNVYIADMADNRIRKVSAKTNKISTIAGNGTSGNTGNGGAATAAEIISPFGIAVDASGNVYFSDGNNILRKINTAGIISVFAGNGTTGFLGDGAQATAAELNTPAGMAADAAGNIYVADQNNNRIRMISKTGIISTVAGNGNAGYLGDNAQATSVRLNNPLGVKVDAAGNIYIADTYNQRVRMVDASGIINTIAGKGIAGYTGDGANATAAEIYKPNDMVVDYAGNVFIADYDNNVIRKVTHAVIATQPSSIAICSANSTSFTTQTFESGFTYQWQVNTGSGFNNITNGGVYSNATTTTLNIAGAAVTMNSYKYVCVLSNTGCGCSINSDTVTLNVYVCNAAYNNIFAFAGNGTSGYKGNGASANAAEISYPSGIAFNANGNAYIADNGNSVVRMVNTAGIISTIAGKDSNGYSGAGGQATAAKLANPTCVAFDDTGNVYITDQTNNVVQKIITKTGVIVTIAGRDSAAYKGDGGLATKADLNIPSGIALDASGNIYFSDNYNNVIRKIDKSGIITTIAGNGFGSGIGVGGYSGDGGQATSAKLNFPWGISFDNAGNLYIADQNNNRIRMVNKSGIITTVAGNGVQGFSGDNGLATAAEMYMPLAVKFDALGNMYIVDAGNSRLRKVNSAGIITTVAGNGSSGNKSNGLPATAASLIFPIDVAVDDSGSIYIADDYNNVIRKIRQVPLLVNPGIVTVCGGANTYFTVTAVSGDTYQWEVNNGSGYINISNGGGYSGATTDTLRIATTTGMNGNKYKCVLSSFACGCSLTSDSAVLKITTPVLTISPASPTICAGSSTQLTASGASTYVWMKSKGLTDTIYDTTTAHPNVTTTYTVTGTASGCSSIDSIVINVAPSPTVTVTGDSSICTGNGTLLRASGATTYNWAPSGSTGSTILFSPASTVTYTITGVNSFGCQGTATKVVTVSPSNGFDLAGNLQVCIDTPGFSSASIQACIFNNRCLQMKGALKLVLDTAFHITKTISDSIAHVSGDTLIWNYDSLSYAGKTHCVALTGSVSAVPAGDSIFVSMFITPTAGDSVPSNNSVTYWVKPFPFNCVGIPFDPNEKSVLPEGNISATQQLSYTIHFQNTGTAPAKNVVVIDTLSQYVDPTTLKVTSSSCEVVTTIVSGNIVKFTFNNINLPDTATSKTSSIGVVKYTISPKSSAIAGDVIKNKAGIYFDANPVVNTNTTVSPIVGGPLSVQNVSSSFNIACFPNPFTSATSVVFNTDGKHYLEIDDMTGRVIENIECTGKQYELQRNNLAAGVYFIKAYNVDKSSVAVTKVVLQ